MAEDYADDQSSQKGGGANQPAQPSRPFSGTTRSVADVRNLRWVCDGLIDEFLQIGGDPARVVLHDASFRGQKRKLAPELWRKAPSVISANCSLGSGAKLR